MLQRVDLYNFRAFERFTVTFGPDAFLVGANNAGKSTIIAAVRAVARMLSLASQRRPIGHAYDNNRSYPIYGFSTEGVGLPRENFRYEFRNLETRIHAVFKGGGQVTAVWPPASHGDDIWNVDSFFYVSHSDRSQPTTPQQVRRLFPSIGVIPVLGPLEIRERSLKDKYIRDNVDGRLASRHFRNQLRMLLAESWPWDGSYESFLASVEEWAPEVSLERPTERIGADGVELDVFHYEDGSHAEKELVWAGDGIQVWLQLLFHLYRLYDTDTVVLDEPDVYLHPDLQRRLVHVLESHAGQTIAATHSPEVLAEANPESVVWIDKSKKRAKRGPKAAELTGLATAIGSQFNIRLAKALRSSVVLFVEGKDMRIMRNIARRLGAKTFASESGITIIPLEGYSNWKSVAPFSWLKQNLLEDSITVAVLLDRDYRPEEAARAVVQRMRSSNVAAHVWSKKELESYLLVPSLLARVSGAKTEDIIDALNVIAQGMKAMILARRIDEAHDFLVDERHHRVTVTETVQARLDEDWLTLDGRLASCPAKDVMNELNRWLQGEGYKPVSSRRLASQVNRGEVPYEMAHQIEELEAMLQASRRAVV